MDSSDEDEKPAQKAKVVSSDEDEAPVKSKPATKKQDSSDSDKEDEKPTSKSKDEKKKGESNENKDIPMILVGTKSDLFPKITKQFDVVASQKITNAD